MRMRIARPHHRPAILKYLHVANILPRPSSRSCSAHTSTTAPYLRHRHLRQRQIMPRREADHPANPTLPLRNQQPPAHPHPLQIAAHPASAPQSRSQRHTCSYTHPSAPHPPAHSPDTDSNPDHTANAAGAAVFSVCPCHGRCVRFGETSTHSRFSGLNRRCGLLLRRVSGFIRPPPLRRSAPKPHPKASQTKHSASIPVRT